MHAALEAALGELVLGPALDLEDEAALAAFFRRHGVSEDDAAALRDGELRRLLVYRELVRGTLKTALEAAIPRTLSRLGPSFDGYFERFLAERAPRTHYLRDVTTEFSDFCAESWSRDPRVRGLLLPPRRERVPARPRPRAPRKTFRSSAAPPPRRPRTRRRGR